MKSTYIGISGEILLDSSGAYAFDSANDLRQGVLLIRGMFYYTAKRIDLTGHVGTVATASFGISTTNTAAGTKTTGARIRAIRNQVFNNLFERIKHDVISIQSFGYDLLYASCKSL
jgi:hypothetical protein